MTDITITTASGTRRFDASQTIKIGRDPACEIVIANPNVSRQHAELRVRDGEWVLFDANSTQGIHVNGRRISEQIIADTTEVALGSTDDAECITFEVAHDGGANPITELSQPGTIVAGEALQRPGGALRADSIAAGTVVTDRNLVIECAGRTHTFLPGTTAVIGRDDSCDVVATNPTVSRRHAEVLFEAGSWHLKDAASNGGTYIDGQRVSDVTLAGSMVAMLGDIEAGERVVLVTSGQRAVSPGRASVGQRNPMIPAIAAIAVVAIVALAIGGFFALRGGTDDPNSNELARATVRLSADNYTGSGVVIDAKNGLIITNAHVGDSSAPGLAVQYPNEFLNFSKGPADLLVSVSAGLDRAAEPKYRAKVVAIDGYLDLAVLKITKTAAGAFVTPADLRGLIAMNVGESAGVESGDKIRIIGYPGIAKSRNPTISDGVIASDVQDDRLATNRAWFNATANASSGNSGGAVVSADNKLIAVFAQNIFGRSATESSNRGRPIDLARELIKAATSNAKYTSPFIQPLSADAKVLRAAIVAPSNQAGFVDGCTTASRGLSVTAEGVGVQIQYEGFEADKHQDVLITVIDLTAKQIVGRMDTASNWPFKFEAGGCLAATVPLITELDASHSYRAQIYLGPSYKSKGIVPFSFGSDTNNNPTTTTTKSTDKPTDTTNVAPPPGADG